MQLLNGKIIAQQILSDLKNQIEHLGKVPGLAVILVGNDPASHLYVSLKERACRKAGIYFEKNLFPENTSTDELIKKIIELNEHNDIDGILVQLPLPNQDTDKIIATIDPNKDVDGFHPKNLQRLEAGETCLVSPVVLGVMKLLEETRESLTDKNAVLIMGKIFAQPFKILLNKKRISVEIVSPEDQDLPNKTKNGEIVITAVGQPGLITGEMIKPGAIVIDVGTTRVGEKVLGDVEATSVQTKAAWLTPVPGGVGPMTVAMLVQNVIQAASLHEQLRAEQKN